MASLIPGKDLQLQDFLCFAVYSANLAFSRVYRPLLDSLGLTYVQYIAMVALWTRDDISVGALGETLYLASNTLTPVIQRLEDLGHVRRVRDTADQRQVRVQLTKKGRALQKRAGDVPGCVLTASGLQIADAFALSGTIAALRDKLLSEAEAAPAPSRRATATTGRRKSPPKRRATAAKSRLRS